MKRYRQFFPVALLVVLGLFISCHRNRADDLSKYSLSLKDLKSDITLPVESSKYANRMNQESLDLELQGIVNGDLFMGRYKIVERLDTFTDKYMINLYLYDVPEDTIFVKTCSDCDTFKYPNKSIATVWKNIVTGKADTTILTSHRLLDWYRSNISPDLYSNNVSSKDNWIAIWGMWKRDVFLQNDTITIETTLNIPDTDASLCFYYKNWHYRDSIIYEAEVDNIDEY